MHCPTWQENLQHQHIHDLPQSSLSGNHQGSLYLYGNQICALVHLVLLCATSAPVSYDNPRECANRNSFIPLRTVLYLRYSGKKMLQLQLQLPRITSLLCHIFRIRFTLSTAQYINID